VTTYSYDILGHLISVNMPRPTGTQTRSFTYSGNYLTSATNPENGTVNYGYNTFMKVASRIDAKGQKVVYTYDSYARLTEVQRYPNGSTEDTCQQEDYYYDSNPFDSNYSQNIAGRLAAVQYYGGSAPNLSNPNLPWTCDTTFIEMYSYSAAGGVVGKRLRVTRTFPTGIAPNGSQAAANADLNGSFTYDNEGRMTGEQYPQSGALGWSGSCTQAVNFTAGPNLTMACDSMGRPYSMTDQTASQTIVGGATYNAAGLLLSNGLQSFTYNSMQQLTQVSGGGMNIQFNYSATQNNGKIVSQIW